MKNYLNRNNLLIFLGGAVVSLATTKFLKSKNARKIAVSAISQGLKVKNNMEHTIASIKEDAEDLYAESKQTCDCKADFCEEEKE